MTFLPIVDRELRVASRRKLTYWGRFTAAAMALGVFGMMMLIAVESRGQVFKTGGEQFQFLKWFCFVFAAGTGVFLTADCLSEEKREGTLGLLFLTDLRGYDIILGKLFSQSAQTLYALLATFPIVALTLIIGGVTGVEFWRSILLICNTAFFTLSLGLLASTFSRDTLRAMNLTLLLCVFFLGVLPLADFWRAGWDTKLFERHLSHASPAFLFAIANQKRPPYFWADVGLQHGLAWLFLIVACVCVPRAWQEKSAGGKRSRQTLGSWWQFGGARARLRRRRRLLARNPVQWLAVRDRSLARLVLLVFFLGLGGIGYAYSLPPSLVEIEGISEITTFALTQCLYFWVTAQVCRFFTEANRNGALELILVTPVEPRQIMRGQWLALARNFAVPALLLMGLMVANGIISIRSFIKSYSVAISSGPAQIMAMQQKQLHDIIVSQSIQTGLEVVLLPISLAAVAWFGMWAGLTSRKPAGAILKSLCLVLLAPFLVATFVEIMVSIATSFGGRGINLPGWLIPLCTSVLLLAKDVFFIRWSRWRLLSRFREIASQSDHKVVKSRRGAPPPMPGLTPPNVVEVKAGP